MSRLLQENIPGASPAAKAMEDRSTPGYLKWIKLTFGVLLIGIFMFGIGPLVLKNEAALTLAHEIEEKEIEAGALWWSEVTIVADAEMNCRNTVQYLPKGPK